jgi:uncharacterized protein (DUF302 family)
MSTIEAIEYGYVRETALGFDQALTALEAALQSEGFGVLTRIDIQARFKEKLGVEFPRYVMLGVCNPPIAYQALRQDINLGLLLPCNAVVYEDGGRISVGVLDAAKRLSATGNPAMQGMALEVDGKLRRAVDHVAAQGMTAGA